MALFTAIVVFSLHCKVY